MKLIPKTITILILSIFLFNCSSDNPENEQEDTTIFLKAKVDGVFNSEFYSNTG